MSSLGKLNLSFNNLQGKLGEQFSHWPTEAFEGNLQLCGGPLDHCSVSSQRSGLSESSVVVISAITTLTAVALLAFGLALFIKHRREFLKRVSEVNCIYSSSSSQAQRKPLFMKGTAKRDYRWDDIMEATNNLSDDFIIGSGGSGTVYRVGLKGGETVAVKKILWKDEFLLNKSFTREVKTLGRIRHRHLVKLIGYCSSKGAGCNLLIYEFMENGSSWDWLHQQPENIKKRQSLDWETRLKIGLALEENYDSNTESHSWFAGSYGYIAPEYAYSLKAKNAN
ncbi:LRR RECEPTOR-LIKE SERINE/THREONINE-PROTEIN KINASE GSO1 [Salix purpurea]|uniref:non-specific serine/threonine protein kinase n=1 Tax=Salix purpurea TaxID=77065 RepID=A0A9Q0QF82_SALPP|nr:LRR RECEPTOR-LIKE SERINE/THREONINE-PROTEIN KINASE GSO1 [Salix purpurea]